jgi:carbonic anhydrase
VIEQVGRPALVAEIEKRLGSLKSDEVYFPVPYPFLGGSGTPETFDKGDLPMPPGRKVAVVACMDARLDPAKALGLSEGDAHVIRNAGGRASDDALRSLIISSRLLGTKEFVVIHHTDCGMLTFTNDDLRRKLRDETGTDPGDVDYLPFSDLEDSVRTDVKRIEESPYIDDAIRVTGFIYDVETGQLREVA